MSSRSGQGAAAWLLQEGILNDAQAEELRRFGRLGADFAERVAGRWGPAMPVRIVDGISSQTIFPAETIGVVETPVLANDGPMPTEFRGAPERSPAIQLHEARLGKVYLGLKRTTLILDGSHFFEGVSTSASSWIAPAFGPAPADLAIGGNVAVLFSNGANLFSHWMFDLLPKLEVLRRAGWSTERVDFYVVNSRLKEFMVESLVRLGIPLAKVIAGAGRTVSADRLLIPSQVRSGFWTPNWVHNFIRAIFSDGAADAEAPKSGRRIYISRANAGRRRILNENEIVRVLKKHEFQVMFAEDLGICGSARLVREADMIVAPHGAGVMNVVFAQPRIRLLETYGAHISREGWLMTKGAGGRHYLLAGMDELGRYPWQAGAYDGLSHIQRNRMDYRIDADALSRALAMLASQ